ncbi:MAG: DUF6683 family protein [Hyphomonas sp.]
MFTVRSAFLGLICFLVVSPAVAEFEVDWHHDVAAWHLDIAIEAPLFEPYGSEEEVIVNNSNASLLPPEALDFRPASALRRQILKEYFPTAEAKAELKAAVGDADLIAAMDGLLPQFGLRTDNVADAMTVWAVGAYSLIHDDDRQLDKATAEAVRGPLALGLMSAPQLGEMSDADKQQFAERLLIISYAYESVRQLKTKDPGGHAQMVQVARDHAAELGFDVDGVTLVKGEGFKPKDSATKAAAPSISAASGSSGAAWLSAQSPRVRQGIAEEAAELGIRAEDMVDGNGDLTLAAKQKMRELGWE